MTVPSGRASTRARALLRALLGGIFAALGLIAGGCGSSTLTYGTPVISISATPGPFTAYLVVLQSIVLTRDDKTVVYPLFNPETVDFTKFVDTTELFGAPAVVEGTYLSATITVSYTNAQIYANVNGTSKAVTVLDASTGSAAGTISYTVKFDPAHPLVIKHGISTPIDFNFDLSASSVLNTTTSPMKLSVRPVTTASTKPVYTKPLRARGLFVTADSANSFTINARAFFDVRSNPSGAIEIQTDENTTYVVNGASSRGAVGFAAVKALPSNTIVSAYGSLDTANLNSVKPNFVATQVYAGTAAEDLARDRITGTVASRSGNTLTLRGAEVQARSLSATAVTFHDSLPVTVSSQTTVAVDGQPEVTSPSIQLVSVGQQVEIEATGQVNSTFTDVTREDATTGLIRLSATSAWGTLNPSAQAGSGAINLISLGGYEPEVLTFTGTGSATGADADPTAYVISNTGGVNLGTLTPGTLPVRFDGNVTPFSSAPPDFTASAVTPGSNTEQLLVIDWVNGGTTAPFMSIHSDGLTVNMSAANVGTSHVVQTGPVYIQTSTTTIDLKNPLVNPKIVPDASLTGQFTVGSSSNTEYSVFHSYSSYQTQLGTVLNGTNKIQKLVAVGKWNAANDTFTAYRIDMVQLP